VKSLDLAGLAALLCLAAGPAAGAAQAVTTRTPDFAGGWIAPRGVVQLNFLHRFSISDAPLRKITNTPTFNLGTGVADRLMVGAVYGSNSTLVPAYPNEWEFYARAMPFSQARGRALDVSLQAGYNLAAESVDGELLLGRRVGRLGVLAAGRAFARAFASDRRRYAVAAGLDLRLMPSVSVAADVGTLLDRAAGERIAWGAGLQLGVPFTPHSFSIHASNVGTASLEGVSVGTRTRWGFEYTVPITLRRYVRAASAAAPATMAAPEAGRDTVVIDIRNLRYERPEVTVTPGTTVVWVNRDPVAHSVIADGGTFDSGLIDPGRRFAWTFGDEGTYTYHCMPHPFMRGRVVVRSMDGAAEREGIR
jgi:plastocyanin